MIEVIQESVVRKYERQEVPTSLVKEILDGRPYFYSGYREVLAGEKKIEDIIGCSEIQTMVITAIVTYLIRSLPENQYTVAFNEVGLHLDKNNNLAADIAIFDRETMLSRKLTSKYTRTVPLAVLEVEIFNEDNIPSEPYTSVPTLSKTERLLEWGVQEVVWIYPQVGKITRAKQGESVWTTTPWQETFELLGRYEFSAGTVVQDFGVRF